jgi:hypothetical protein
MVFPWHWGLATFVSYSLAISKLHPAPDSGRGDGDLRRIWSNHFGYKDWRIY